jgi:hypothetical protein
MSVSFEQIKPLVGSYFGLQTSAGLVQLKLVQAQESERRGLPAQFRTPLSLLFAGPPSPVLAQDNYQIEHPALGSQVWMLVPVMSTANELEGGVAYEAIFA